MAVSEILLFRTNIAEKKNHFLGVIPEHQALHININEWTIPYFTERLLPDVNLSYTVQLELSLHHNIAIKKEI
ncbi:MAG TPA: hypothetical protein P5105_03585 [Victivallales bacterium]|nr:hypothetical protein [Victivallales bacterium]